MHTGEIGLLQFVLHCFDFFSSSSYSCIFSALTDGEPLSCLRPAKGELWPLKEEGCDVVQNLHEPAIVQHKLLYYDFFCNELATMRLLWRKYSYNLEVVAKLVLPFLY